MRRWRKRCAPAAWREADACARSGAYWAGRMHGGKPGDRRAGVVWHTQGSGKSFSMLFYAARVVRHPAMQNPTLVVLTDRNDLDDQLFGQFQRCHDILGQTPVQAANREQLRELLAVASGGVVFTTIQKFMPEKGEKMPALSRAPEHRRHRRRSAPQPIRPDRRPRPPPARCAAERVVHRLHRHAHREDRRQHAGGLRRLHQHLRHPARRRRQGHGADLLREPHRQAGPERRRAAEARRGVRGDHRRRGADQEGKAQDQVGRAGGAGGRPETHRAHRRRPGGAFREAPGGDGRQGDDRLHEPPHLRGPLQRAHRAAPRLGQRQGRRRRSREKARPAW